MASSLLADDTAIDFGRLANNYMVVQSLQSSLSRADTNINLIPKLVLRIINEGAWEEWFIPETSELSGWKNQETGRVNPADFREFIKSPRPLGCGCSIHVFERMIRDTPAWEAFEGLLVGSPGGPNNPSGKNQYSEVNSDSVIVDLHPATIPLSPDVPRPVMRDRRPATGNAASYAIRRLKKAAPELADRVIKGELSANAAAVQAGFREVKITVPRDSPSRAARILARHMNQDQVKALIRELCQAANIPFVDETT